MDEPLKLFMVLLGCRPKGRHTEQHDIFFGIGQTVKDLIPEIIAFWPEAKGKIHIDAWRTVTCVNDYKITVQARNSEEKGITENLNKLFFINLGGYKEHEFDEYHYKMVVVAPDKGTAIKQAKQTAFFKHTRFKGAESHIDDKFGIDVDEFYEIKEMLSPILVNKYQINILQSKDLIEDKIHLGYFQLDKL